MTAKAVSGEDLANLARFHFGGWYEAVAAAGLEPEGRPRTKRPARGRSSLRPLTEAMLRGPRSSSELERITGVRAGTIRRKRRRLGITRDERRRKDRSWLPAVRELLGKMPDPQVARRVGVSANTIARARAELGIPAFHPEGGSPEGDSVPLDGVPPEEVLRRIRARARSGKSLRARNVTGRLRALADFHFGGWYEAVEAAGLVTEGTSRPRGEVAKPKRLRKLTSALLRGPRSSRELERQTGIPRREIRRRREKLGIHRDESPKKDRSWVMEAFPLFGKVTDAEIARRVGVSPPVVGRVRRDFGIEARPSPALSNSDEVRRKLHEYEPEEIQLALRKVGRRAAYVLRRRVLTSEPETLDALAAHFGITKQSVRGHEQRGLALLLDELDRLEDHGARR